MAGRWALLRSPGGGSTRIKSGRGTKMEEKAGQKLSRERVERASWELGLRLEGIKIELVVNSGPS